ncbi:MAG: HEPN domain-containing protein, partial [Bacteroidota bacterium]
PSKRGPLALRVILDDYEEFRESGEAFHAYFKRQGKRYFYSLLKDVGDAKTLEPEEFLDWGQADTFTPEIGVGECAGVVIDLVETLLYEAEEKLEWAAESLEGGHYADSIYHSYNAWVQGAKALLVADGKQTNTQAKIISDFQEEWVAKGLIEFSASFPELVYQIQKEAPTVQFAKRYLAEARAFFGQARAIRNRRVAEELKSSVH